MMKFLAGILLAVSILFSGNACSSKPDLTPIAVDHDRYLTPEKYDIIRSSAARCNIFENGRHRGHGTAWAIQKDDIGTLWITCGHVVDTMIAEGGSGTVEYKDCKDEFVIYPMSNIRKCDYADVAFFTTESFTKSILPLAKVEDIWQLKPGDLLAAAGCPLELFPPVVSVGVYNEITEQGISTTVGGWFGSSGSAVVDVRTMKVIGIQFQFYKQPYRSDEVWALPAFLIRKFLESQQALK